MPALRCCLCQGGDEETHNGHAAESAPSQQQKVKENGAENESEEDGIEERGEEEGEEKGTEEEGEEKETEEENEENGSEDDEAVNTEGDEERNDREEERSQADEETSEGSADVKNDRPTNGKGEGGDSVDSPHSTNRMAFEFDGNALPPTPPPMPQFPYSILLNLRSKHDREVNEISLPDLPPPHLNEDDFHNYFWHINHYFAQRCKGNTGTNTDDGPVDVGAMASSDKVTPSMDYTIATFMPSLILNASRIGSRQVRQQNCVIFCCCTCR